MLVGVFIDLSLCIPRFNASKIRMKMGKLARKRMVGPSGGCFTQAVPYFATLLSFRI